VGLRADLDAEARRKILCLCRGSNPGRPVRSSYTILTELPRLLNTHVAYLFFGHTLLQEVYVHLLTTRIFICGIFNDAESSSGYTAQNNNGLR
jgi:hypothetical protein